jgi:hypothetical protein
MGRREVLEDAQVAESTAPRTTTDERLAKE